MRYGNWNEPMKSGSAPKYFLSLPVNIQLILHKYNTYIRAVKELHDDFVAAENYMHPTKLSERK